MKFNLKGKGITALLLLTFFALTLGITYGTEEAEKNTGDALKTEEVGATSKDDTLKPTDKLNIKQGTVLSNIFLGKESLSGISETDAEKKLTDFYEQLRRTDFMMVSPTVEDYRFGGTIHDLGVTYDDSRIDEQLDSIIAKGNPIERYKAAKDNEHDPRYVDLFITVDENTVNQYFQPLYEAWPRNPKNASATMRSGVLTFVEGIQGCSYDLTPGIQKLLKDLPHGDIGKNDLYEIDPGETTVDPEISTERIQDFTVIGSYTTNYVRPTDQILLNRQQNLVNSTNKMNGQIFAPGEVISALGLYGAVTLDNGYAVAGTYNNGGHVDEIGGGLCQTTSTMYNAVLMAELEIVYRHNHTYLVTYIDPSRDAMVYAAGGSDFKFKNSSSDYIIIDAYVNTNDVSLTVNIIGHEDHAADHSVRYESEVLSLTPPSANIVQSDNFALGWGSRKSSVSGDLLCGCKSRLWKITKDGGVENRVLFTAQDSYRPMSATIYCAKDVTINVGTGGSRSGGYSNYTTTFVNGVNLSDDPARWSDEKLQSFNKDMAGRFGKAWPDSGNGFSFDGKVMKVNTMSDNPPESTENKSEESSEQAPD